MANVKLFATKRTTGKNQDIRAGGNIPAIIYGPGLAEESAPIEVEYQVFRKAFREAGESTVIDLELDGKDLSVLVHSFERHPVTGDFTHIDFYAMNMKQEVHTNIHLNFIGTAPVVKEKNGVLVISKETLEVKCLPKYLVHDITVDVSGLTEYHDHILVKDVPVPEGITVLDHAEDAVITATPPKKEIPEDLPVAAEGEAAPEGKTEKAEIPEDKE